MIDDPAAARQALRELESLLALEPGDHALSLRLADIDILLGSVEAIAAVAAPGSADARAVTLKSIEIGTEIARLIVDVLGWYVLPEERAGSNEPPLGRPHLRRLFIEQLAVDEARLMQLRDDLASLLLSLPAERDARHD